MSEIKWEVNDRGGITLSKMMGSEDGWIIEEIPIDYEPSIYNLYEIPSFGGDPRLSDAVRSLKEALETVEKWT